MARTWSPTGQQPCSRRRMRQRRHRRPASWLQCMASWRSMWPTRRATRRAAWLLLNCSSMLTEVRTRRTARSPPVRSRSQPPATAATGSVPCRPTTWATSKRRRPKPTRPRWSTPRRQTHRRSWPNPSSRRAWPTRSTGATSPAAEPWLTTWSARRTPGSRRYLPTRAGSAPWLTNSRV